MADRDKSRLKFNESSTHETWGTVFFLQLQFYIVGLDTLVRKWQKMYEINLESRSREDFEFPIIYWIEVVTITLSIHKLSLGDVLSPSCHQPVNWTGPPSPLNDKTNVVELPPFADFLRSLQYHLSTEWSSVRNCAFWFVVATQTQHQFSKLF